MNACFICVVAILAFSIEYQSRVFRKEERDCEKLYMAADACCELAPAYAAAFATPLIAIVASLSFTPLFVNLPILEVMSEKL